MLYNRCNLENVHHILIGYNQHHDYVINREIIRSNFSEGGKIWLTTVYNGDLDEVASGCGENTFITITENNGYAYGALDAINEGLEFALHGYRDIIVLSNFDGLFFSQEKYKDLINEFIDSNKPFAAGFHESHHFPMSDLMLFKRDILNSLLPILPNVYPDREKIEFLQNEYRGTQLGFNNVEEWILNALYKQSADHPDDAAAPNKIWHRIQRDGHPRYRFTEKYAFGHLHDDQEKRGLLKHYNATKGSNISQWVGR